jgi:hypothetical protein
MVFARQPPGGERETEPLRHLGRSVSLLDARTVRRSVDRSTWWTPVPVKRRQNGRLRKLVAPGEIR